MPLGTEQQIIGTVARGPWGYVLHVGNGGVWELDCGLFTRLRLRSARARAVRVPQIRSHKSLLRSACRTTS